MIAIKKQVTVTTTKEVDYCILYEKLNKILDDNKYEETYYTIPKDIFKAMFVRLVLTKQLNLNGNWVFEGLASKHKDCGYYEDWNAIAYIPLDNSNPVCYDIIGESELRKLIG